MSSCPICILSIKKALICPTCQYTACIDCIQSCIVKYDKVECISCHEPFTYVFIRSEFPASFVTSYIDNPRIKAIYDDQVRLIGIETAAIKPLLQQLKKIKTGQANNDTYYSLRTIKDAIKYERKHLRLNVNGIVEYKCAGCKQGVYTIEENMQCKNCKKFNCMKCESVVVENTLHECNKSDLDTLAEIKKESIRCPKCHIWISKIDGCNDMFCTKCMTPFNYRTGLIIRKRFHNPHYQEYLDRGGQVDIWTAAVYIPNNRAIGNFFLRNLKNHTLEIDKALRDLRNYFVIIREYTNSISRNDYRTNRKAFIYLRDRVILGERDLIWFNDKVTRFYKHSMYLKDVCTLNARICAEIAMLFENITDQKFSDIVKYINDYVVPEYRRRELIPGFQKKYEGPRLKYISL